MRLKPSASRQESKEIYLLCKNFGNSQDALSQKLRDSKRRILALENDNSPQAQKVYQEVTEIHKNLLQELIDQAHKDGYDIPDKIKDQLKNSPIGDQLKLDNRMSLREKQKAQKRAKELADEEFTKATGIKNLAKDMTMENLMAKYQYDMKVMQKRAQKMKEQDRDDVDYDELTVEEDEFDDEESKKFAKYIKERREEILKKTDYEDTPYATQEDESRHEQDQFQELAEKIEQMKPEHQKLKDKLVMEKYKDQFQSMEEMYAEDVDTEIGQ